MAKKKVNKNIKTVGSHSAKQTTVHKHNLRHSKKAKSNNWQFPLGKKNLIYIGIGLAVIIVGYLLMATGITEQPAIVNGKWDNPFAISIAPFIIVIGYCIIIPYAIMKVFKKDKSSK